MNRKEDVKNNRLLTLVGLFSIFIGVSTCLVVYRTYHVIPLQDHWVTVGFYENYLKHGLSFAALWAQHNEHRIFFPRMLFLLDYRLGHGTGYLLITLTLLFQGLQVFLLNRCLRMEPNLEREDRLFLTFAAFVFSFWLIQSGNFIWSFQVLWMLNGLFASLAAFYISRLNVQKEGRSNWRDIILAGGCCLVATYSLANGIFICAILWIVVLKTALPRRFIFFWTCFGLLLGFSYLHHYHPPSNQSSLGDSLHLGTLHYLLVYLGNPVSRFYRPAGVLLGALGLGFSFLFAWRFIREERSGFYRSFVFAQIAYVVSTAMITAMGRNKFGIDQATSSRYFTPVLLFWFFMLTLIYVEIKRRKNSTRWLQAGVLIGFLFFVLPVQIGAIPHRANEYLKYDEGALGLMVGVRDSSTLYYVNEHTGDSTLWDQNDFLKQNRLSVYHEPWTLTVGRSFSRAYGVDSSFVWQGEIRRDRTLDFPPHDGYFVTGKISHADGVEIPKVILFVNRDTIVGYAKTEKRPCPGCFSGYVKGLENREFAALGLDEKSGRVLRISAVVEP